MKLLYRLTPKLLTTILTLLTTLSVCGQSKLWGLTSAGGNEFGTLFSIATGGNTLLNQHKLNGSPGSSPQYISLVQANNGMLYGATYEGGIANSGIIFQYDPVNDVYTKKIDLVKATGCNPRGPLMLASDGKLYGMTTVGGANDGGAIFQYDPVSNTYTKKIDLTTATGIYPFGGLVQISNGNIYGMTNSGGANGVGVIFQYDPIANIYTKKIDLTPANGCNPYGSLIKGINGKLYGMTLSGGSNSAGVIFEYDPVGNTYTRKINLSPANGSYPWGSLMQAANGKFYGLTSSGGFYDGGVIFQYDVVSNLYQKLYDLNGANGEVPYGSLIQANDGNLYGMTYRGGLFGIGVLFQYNLSTGVYSMKSSFNTSGGYRGYGTLVQASDGNLYGTTFKGGTKDVGVIFQYNISTNTFTKKVDFNAAPEGAAPNGSLVRASNGKFYGMTRYGGANNSGVIFEYDTATNLYTKKIDLNNNGNYPRGTMIQATNGMLYGLTTFGGSNDLGTVFQYDPLNNIFTKKINLAANTGINPSGSLVQVANGKMYGLTYGGGSKDGGVLFEYDPGSNIYTKKIDLDSISGNNPYGSLLLANDGKLYGMTTLGGANDLGVIFQYNPTTNTYTKKIDLSQSEGGIGYGSLMQATNGRLYGMTYRGGSHDAGVIFQYDLNTNTYTRKIDLDTLTGAGPYGDLMQASDGNLYGMTSIGGANGAGVVFRYNTSTNVYTKMFDFDNTNGSAPLGKLIEIVCPVPAKPDSISGQTSICAGTTSAYSVTPVSGATQYFWSVPPGATINSGQNTTSVSITFGTTSGNISVTANNGCGVGQTKNLPVSVTSKPTAGIIAAPSATVCQGASVVLTGTGGTSYSWTGGISNGVSFIPSSTTTYTLTATTNGCSDSKSITITVTQPPAVSASASPSTTVCTGTSVTLNGTGAQSYTWTGGVANGIAFIPSATATYTVTGTTAAGCSATSTITVSVAAAPGISISASPSSTVCEGSEVTLNATGAASYNWSNGVTTGIPFIATNTRTYSVTGTNAGCSGTSSITITVVPLPNIDIIASPSSVICQGSAVTLSGTGGSNYSWTGGVTNGTPFTPASTSTYTITGSANGCSNTKSITVTVNQQPTIGATASPSATICGGSPITLNGTGGISYSWNNGVVNGSAFIPLSSDVYIVTGTDANGCTATGTISVSVLPNAPPVVSASPSTAVCQGSAVTLTATGSSSYIWSNGVTAGVPFTPGSTATYSVTGTTNGCSSTATITITVSPLPTVGAIASPSATICNGSSVTLVGTGAGAGSYSWSGGVTNGQPFTPDAISTYTVTGTSVSGCTATSVITITPTPILSVNASSTTICSGDTVTLTASGGSSYKWTGGITNGVAFNPSSSATYTVTGTASNGCTATKSISITVNPTPSVHIDASPASVICSGSPVTLSGTGASSYTWSGGITNEVPFNPSSTATYTVTGYDMNGCAGTDTITVTVHTTLSMPGPISGVTVLCSGTTNTYSVSPVPNSSGYTWSLPSGWTGTSTTNTISAVSSTTSGEVSVTADNSCGSSPASTLNITVNETPTVGVTGSQSSNPCPGTLVTLFGTGADSYTWSGGITDGVQFALNATTTFTVTGTNSNGGCTGTFSFTLPVNDLPDVNATAFPSASICEGNSVKLNGTGALSYSWSGGISDGVSFTPAATETYIVTGTDAFGCTNTKAITVTVNNTIAALTPISGDTSMCLGVSKTYSITPVAGASSYTWTVPSGWAGASTTNSITVTPSSSGTLSVSLNNGCGASNPETLDITVHSLPTIGISSNPSTTICAGTSVTLSGTGADAYSWTGGITDNVSFMPAITDSYTVTGTDIHQCSATATVTVSVNPLPTVSIDASPSISICDGTAVTLTASGASSYSWSGGLTNGIAFIPVETTTYTVTGTTNGCNDTKAITITVKSRPTVGASGSPSTTLCVGDPVTLTGSGAASYSWTGNIFNGTPFHPLASGTYTVTGTAANGCTGTSSIAVTVNQLPNVIANASPSTTICAGAFITLTGSGAGNYTWSGGVLNGVATNPSTTTTYIVTGTDNNSCVNTDEITITVNPLPTVGITANPSTTLCSGASLTLTATGASSYSWNGGVTNGVPFNALSSTTYTVSGTSNGCSATKTIAITVNQPPTINASAAPSATVCIGSSLSLNATGASDYSWTGGVINGTPFFPVATATYTVTGTDNNGCTNTATQTVTVNDLPTVGATASPSSSVCTGSPVTLTGTGADSYNWTGGITNGVPFIPSGSTTYTVTGTAITGCSASRAITIIVNLPPVVGANVSPSSSVCEGSPVTLNGTGAATYTWTGGVSNGVAFTPSATATYTVTGTTGGCSATAMATVTVNAAPEVTASANPSATVCAGSPVSLSGNGAASYIWSGGVVDGASFIPSATQSYIVTGTDALGCTATSSITVTVLSFPSISEQPTDQVIEEGNDAYFITASDPGASYQWQVDAGSGFNNLTNTGQYSGATDDTLKITGVDLFQNDYKYRCIISIGTCSDTTTTALLIVYIKTATEETYLQNVISVFPNPADEQITVSFNSTGNNTCLIRLFDTNGRMIINHETNSQHGMNSIELDLKHLPAGMYFLSVLSDRINRNIKIAVQ